ncbi:MAG TPA: hypothetical protein VFW78_09250 [Bacteroidia bacterium]|nr:hypothetical protein [Bacteroidia bacterium]
MRNAIYLFGLFILSACQQSTGNGDTTIHQTTATSSSSPNIPETSDTYNGFTIVNKGPRGGGYTDPAGHPLGYRIFRVQLINDSLVPLDFNINFTSNDVPLRPKSDGHLKVFLFPKSMTPDKQEEYDFGITGLPAFLDTGLREPTKLQITIQPKKEYVFYVGALLYYSNGSARAKLIASGQYLIYKIDINEPPPVSAEIPCGQFRFHTQ